jgi:Ca2+-binding EF-hand superfamily protein
MDRNGDGVVTRNEWRGNDRSFRVHDWNNDGVLSGDEVRPGGKRPVDRGDDAQDRNAELNDWSAESFARLDLNGDGRITRDEWQFNRESFRRADHDGNEVITRAEFLNDPDRREDDRGAGLANLDRDGNSVVTRDEWRASRGRFDSLDVNGDGVLSRRELGEDNAPADLFESLDADRDGVVSPREWRWSRASFNARDLNGNAVLTRNELERSPETPQTPRGETVAQRAGAARGLAEGRAAGREDRERNQGWDLEGQRELESADSGYSPDVGPREEYQAAYREAFRRGYREGYGPRS